MSSPQLENGFIKISTELFEAIYRSEIPAKPRKCLDFIIRKTYGWHKKEDKISLSQFTKELSMWRASVCRNLKFLEDSNIIFSKKHGSTGTAYSINKDYSKWRVVAPVRLGKSSNQVVAPVLIGSRTSATRGSRTGDNRVVAPVRHTIDTITKDTTKDTITKDTTLSPFANAPAEKKNIQADFVFAWAKLYESETKEKFKIEKKDYVLVSRLLKDHNYDDLIKKTRLLFLACQEKSLWFTNGGMADFSIWKLSSRWNELIETKGGGKHERVGGIKKSELDAFLNGK